MATSLTNSIVDNTSDAGFRVWGLEFHNQLLACGLTQTADTGQINWATVVRAVAGLYAGSEVWRFNDTLQSTTPIFLIFSFGSGGGSQSAPLIRLIVCGSTNGASSPAAFNNVGCICGMNSYSAIPNSAITYLSRFVYNATMGFFGFVWKIGANTVGSSVDAAYQAGFVFRSNNSAGSATGDAVMILTAGATQAGSTTTTYGCMQCMNFVTGLIYPPNPNSQGQVWSLHPFMGTSTIVNAQLAVDPIFFMTPSIGITNCLARGLKTETPLHSQISLTLVGATAHNYIQVGNVFGGYSSMAYTGTDAATYTNNNIGMLMLWE